MEIDQVVFTVIRAFLSFTFINSSLRKLKSPWSFAATIRSFQILPKCFAKPFAVMIILGEAIASVWMIVGWKIKLGGYLYVCLLLSFMIGVGINLLRGRNDLDCGCFGEKHLRKADIRLFIFEAVLLLLAFTIVRWGGGYFTYDNNARFWHDLLHLQTLIPLFIITTEFFISIALLTGLVRIVRTHQQEK